MITHGKLLVNCLNVDDTVPDTGTVLGITELSTFTKNTATSKSFSVQKLFPTFNLGGSNANTSVNILEIDSVNTSVTGLDTNLIKASYGSAERMRLTSQGTLHAGELITNAKIDYEIEIDPVVSYSLSTLTGGATTVVFGDSGYSNAITIPFTFNFYGLNYTSVYVATSGYVSFSIDSTYAYYTLTGQDALYPNNFIAGYLVDLDVSVGTVKYETFNSTPNRIFVVEFNAVETIENADPITFQIKLFETSNNIEIHTDLATTTNATVFQGIQSSDIARFKYISGRNSQIFNLNDDVVRFVPKSIGSITKNLSNKGVSTKDIYIKNDLQVDGISNFTDGINVSKLTTTNTSTTTLNVGHAIKIPANTYYPVMSGANIVVDILDGSSDVNSGLEIYGINSYVSNKNSSALTGSFIVGAYLGAINENNTTNTQILTGSYSYATNYGTVNYMTGSYSSVYTSGVVSGKASGGKIEVNSTSGSSGNSTEAFRANNTNFGTFTGNIDGIIAGVANSTGGSCSTLRGFESSASNSAAISGELNAGNLYVINNSAGTAPNAVSIRVVSTNNGTISGVLYGAIVTTETSKSVPEISVLPVTSTTSGTLGTASTALIVGKFLTQHTGTATIPISKSLETSIANNSTGIITEHRSLNIKQPSNTSGTITTNTGIYVESQNAGTITNNYAIRVADQSSTYALYTGSGPVRLGDHVSLNNTGAASELRLYEPLGSGTNYTAFKAQTQVADLTYTLPNAYAAVTGYMLSSTDAGVLSWVAGGGGTIDGTGSANKLAVWSDSDTLTFDTDLHYDSTNDYLGLKNVSPATRLDIIGLTISTDADATIGAVKETATFTKNDANTRTFSVQKILPTFNFGGSNTTTTVNVLEIDSTNTSVTGLTANLIKASYGASTKFTVESDGDVVNAGIITVQGAGTSIFTGSVTINGDVILGDAATDTVTINAGPINLPNATSSADALVIGADVTLFRSAANVLKTEDSLVIGSTTSNAFQGLGVTINQGANDDEILSFRSSDVSHGFTSITSLDTFGTFYKTNATGGGLIIEGFTGTTETIGLTLRGTSSSASPDTTHSTAGTGYIHLTTSTITGSSRDTVTTTGANLVCIRSGVSGSTTKAIIDAQGNYYQDGTDWTTYDDYDDIQLLNALDYSLNKTLKQQLKEESSAWLKENEVILEKSGIVSYNRDTDSVPFINQSELSKLHNGAIRQLSNKFNQVIKTLVNRINVLENALFNSEALG